MTRFSFALNVACVGLGVTEQNHNNGYYPLYSIQNSDGSIQLLTALAQSSSPAWTNCRGAAAHTDNLSLYLSPQGIQFKSWGRTSGRAIVILEIFGMALAFG